MAVVIRTIVPILGHPPYLPFSFVYLVGPLSLVAEITSTWSVALLKTSIAVMLLRFQQARGWARFLYFVMGVQIVTAVFVTVMQSTRCVPIQALWDTTLVANHCWSQGAFKVGLTVASVLVILTDVIFALIPLLFLRHIRRSIRDRLIIAFLMSLGLFASAASIVKTVIVQRFDQSSDASGSGLSIALWASIEAQVGIVAACIPCLRAPFLRLLGRLGLSSELSGGTAGNKPGWQGQSQPVGHTASRTVRIHGGSKAGGGFLGSRATQGTTNESDEDVLMPGALGRSATRIEVKTDIDIELASVVTR